MASVEELLTAYPWYDHPDGPKFVETHRDPYRTSGHWLFLPGAVSYFHKVTNNEELWLIHQGRLMLHVLNPDGSYQLLRLGTDLAAEERPVAAVPTGSWQAAELPADTPFAFGANVCAPCFSFEEFGIADREELLRQYPGQAELISRLAKKKE